MSKAEFLKKYKALNQAERREIREYWESLYKSAIFPESLAQAEKVLLWIRNA